MINTIQNISKNNKNLRDTCKFIENKSKLNRLINTVILYIKKRKKKI